MLLVFCKELLMRENISNSPTLFMCMVIMKYLYVFKQICQGVSIILLHLCFSQVPHHEKKIMMIVQPSLEILNLVSRTVYLDFLIPLHEICSLQIYIFEQCLIMAFGSNGIKTILLLFIAFLLADLKQQPTNCQLQLRAHLEGVHFRLGFLSYEILVQFNLQ